MKFSYIPISTIIAEVRADLARRDRMGIINDQDCQGWIIETLRAIGGSSYDVKPLIFQVTNNQYVLPKDFYKIDNMWLIDGGIDSARWERLGNSTIWFTTEGKVPAPGRIIYPGDSFTGTRYCTHNQVSQDYREASYRIVHPNIFRCSLPSCVVGMEYLCLPFDNGEFLIPDEIYTFKAAKAFCTLKLLHEDYLDQKVPRYIYKDIEADYDYNLDMAQAMYKFPDPADDAARAHLQDHRYDAFKFKYT